mgnify:CR=1 FL=1
MNLSPGSGRIPAKHRTRPSFGAFLPVEAGLIDPPHMEHEVE